MDRYFTFSILRALTSRVGKHWTCDCGTPVCKRVFDLFFVIRVLVITCKGAPSFSERKIC